MAQSANTDFGISGCLVEPQRNRISGVAGAVTLEPRVMDTLVVLARHHGKVLSRDQLIELAWDGRVVSDEVVNRSIFELRKAFRVIGLDPDVIETVRKRGYRLSVAPESPSWLASMNPGPGLHRGAVLMLGALTLLAITWWYLNRQDADGLSIPDDDAQVLTVNPIQIESEANGANAVALALHQGIVDAISHQPAVIVRKPATVSGLAAGSQNDGEPALNLRMALSARSDGNWGVTARVEGQGAEPLWQDELTLAADLSDLNRVQREVSFEVMAALNSEIELAARCPWPTDAHALELYFEGRNLVDLRGAPNIRNAIGRFGDALDRQPEFAHAWASLGRAYELLPVYVEGDAAIRERARTDPLSKAAYRHALDLCPGHALAFQKVGPVPEYEGHNTWILNHYRMRKAFELDPNDAEATRHYANIMFRVGRLEEWRELLEHANRVDPHNPRILLELANMSMDYGELDRAEAYVTTARMLGSSQFYPMMEHRLALERGDQAAAEQLTGKYPPQLRTVFAALSRYWVAPDDTMLRQALTDTLRDAMQSSEGPGATLAHIFGVRIGDLDLAFEGWERMRKDNFNLTTLWMPEATEFRNDPRYFDLVDSLGLVEFWHHVGDPDWCTVGENHISCRL